MLAAISAAALRTRRAGLAAPVLVVTAKPGIATGVLQRIVDRYVASPDAVGVEIAVSGYREQSDMVRDGRADCALLALPVDPRGLEVEPLITGPRVAALPVDHELAGHDTLFCCDLDGHPIPQYPDASAEEVRFWAGRDRGAPPSDPELPVRGPLVTDPWQMLETIALGQAVALIPLPMAETNPRADIDYRPVVDASPFTIVIAWPVRARASYVAAFVRTAIEVASAESAGPAQALADVP